MVILPMRPNDHKRGDQASNDGNDMPFVLKDECREKNQWDVAQQTYDLDFAELVAVERPVKNEVRAYS